MLTHLLWSEDPQNMAKIVCFSLFSCDRFFLRVVTPPYLNRQILWYRFSSPPSSRSRLGTEGTPPLFRQRRTSAVCLKRVDQLHFPFKIKFATPFSSYGQIS